jgi:hypothetical protein
LYVHAWFGGATLHVKFEPKTNLKCCIVQLWNLFCLGENLLSGKLSSRKFTFETRLLGVKPRISVTGGVRVRGMSYSCKVSAFASQILLQSNDALYPGKECQSCDTCTHVQNM